MENDEPPKKKQKKNEEPESDVPDLGFAYPDQFGFEDFNSEQLLELFPPPSEANIPSPDAEPPTVPIQSSVPLRVLDMSIAASEESGQVILPAPLDTVNLWTRICTGCGRPIHDTEENGRCALCERQCFAVKKANKWSDFRKRDNVPAAELLAYLPCEYPALNGPNEMYCAGHRCYMCTNLRRPVATRARNCWSCPKPNIANQ